MKIMHDDLHVLTGSYALDAIGDAEREEFERHLQHCPACEAEVRGMRETAVRLALARAVAPPARLEQRVLAATYRTRQLPPPPRDQIRAARTFPRRLAVLAAAASVAATDGLTVHLCTRRAPASRLASAARRPVGSRSAAGCLPPRTS